MNKTLEKQLAPNNFQLDYKKTVFIEVDSSNECSSKCHLTDLPTDHHIEVSGLEGDKDYLILVSAANQVGASDSVKFNVKTKPPAVASFVDGGCLQCLNIAFFSSFPRALYKI